MNFMALLKQTHQNSRPTTVLVSEVPSWVRSLKTRGLDDIPSNKIMEGSYYLLSNVQIKLENAGHRVFYACSVQVVNETGVGKQSQIKVDYDPFFQELEFHEIKIIRKQEELNRLKVDDIHLIQREKDMESRIYSGLLTAVKELYDVRVGDVIHYSYSINSREKLFERCFCHFFNFSFDVPIKKIFYRLLTDSLRPVDYVAFIEKLDLYPKIRQLDQFKEYVWSLDDIVPEPLDTGIPEWFVHYSWGQVVDHKSWEEVEKIIAPHFESSNLEMNIEGHELQLHKVAQSLKKEDPKKTLQSVLQFVQEEIRYVSSALGLHSHLPHHPEEVLQKRYGDCKDKSLLMVSLLKELEIKAWVCLVNTSLKASILEMLPSPHCFNHAVVKVMIDKQIYWLDTTIIGQRGQIDSLFPVFNSAALVLGEKAQRPEMIPTPELVSPILSIDEHFELQKVGGDTIISTQLIFHSYRSEMLREQLRHEGKDRLAKSFLEYWSNRFSDCEPIIETVIHDDEVNNSVLVNEKYRIGQYFLRHKNDSSLYEALIQSGDIGHNLTLPEGMHRSHQLRVAHPVFIDHQVQVTLPKKMKNHKHEYQISNQWFDYSCKVISEKNHYRFHYQYKSKCFEVKAHEFEVYKQAVFEAQKHLTWGILISKDYLGMSKQFWIFTFMIIVFVSARILFQFTL